MTIYTVETSAESLVLAASNVCFDSTSSTIGDEFNPPYDGEIYGIELRHQSGDVSCRLPLDDEGSNWGCNYYELMVVMVKNDNNAVYYPTATTAGISSISYFNSNLTEISYCQSNFPSIYEMSDPNPELNYNSNAETLRLIDEVHTYSVVTSEVFSLQYTEGYCEFTTGDNSGISCADVYFLYTSDPTANDGWGWDSLSYDGYGTEEGYGIGTLDYSSPFATGFDFDADESATLPYDVLCIGVDCGSSDDHVLFYGIPPTSPGQSHQIGLDIKLNGETTTVQHPVCTDDCDQTHRIQGNIQDGYANICSGQSCSQDVLLSTMIENSGLNNAQLPITAYQYASNINACAGNVDDNFINDAICREPSAAPTTDPTNDPTSEPTTEPTSTTDGQCTPISSEECIPDICTNEEDLYCCNGTDEYFNSCQAVNCGCEDLSECVQGACPN